MNNRVRSICIQTWNKVTTIRFDRERNQHGASGKSRSYNAVAVCKIEKMIEEGYLTVKFVHFGTDGTCTLIVAPTEFYPIALLGIDDLADRGFDVTGVGANTLKEIAEEMGDNYVAYGNFWEDLDGVAEEFDLVKLDEDEDSDQLD